MKRGVEKKEGWRMEGVARWRKGVMGEEGGEGNRRGLGQGREGRGLGQGRDGRGGLVNAYFRDEVILKQNSLAEFSLKLRKFHQRFGMAWASMVSAYT